MRFRSCAKWATECVHRGASATVLTCAQRKSGVSRGAPCELFRRSSLARVRYCSGGLLSACRALHQVFLLILGVRLLKYTQPFDSAYVGTKVALIKPINDLQEGNVTGTHAVPGTRPPRSLTATLQVWWLSPEALPLSLASSLTHKRNTYHWFHLTMLARNEDMNTPWFLLSQAIETI